ncbi:synaptosomal-associated protein 23-like [Convolutriloba macropyga]|uniref:synaptosomal-associated protein 23-like n=1 Tax=Convolutriloba macropyga TaxID=536237 RepID=UPI003F528F8D
MAMINGVTIEMKKTALNELSLRSTRRILDLCEESQNNATQTLVALDHQGEQLSSIEANLGCLHDDLRAADDKLNTAVVKYNKTRFKFGLCGLEHLFLRVRRRMMIFFNVSPRKASIFKSNTNSDSNTPTKEHFENSLKSANSKTKAGAHLEVKMGQHQQHNCVSRSPSSVSRVASEPALSAQDKTEREIEDNFSKISDLVYNLKQMSLDINTELTNQNTQTERLVKKISLNRNQVEKANRKADILLN